MFGFCLLPHLQFRINDIYNLLRCHYIWFHDIALPDVLHNVILLYALKTVR